MGFIVGLLSGVVIGAAGAVYYSVQTGRDLREVADQLSAQVRAELANRDLDELATRIETRVSQLQSQVEEAIGQARSTAAGSNNGAAAEATTAAANAADAAGEAVDDAAETVREAAEAVGDAGSDAIDEAEANAKG